MHITFTDEQKMLQESADKFLRDNYSFDHRQAVVKAGRGYSSEMWNTFAELGWAMLPFNEEAGGFGGGAIENMMMGENFGRYLVLEPYLETVILLGGLLQACDSDELRATYLENLMAGGLQGALACAENGCGLPAGAVATTATETAEGFVLSGRKTVVYNGPDADLFVVSAGIDGEGDRPALFLVAADAAGLERRDYPTYDGRRACDLVLDNVPVPRSHQLCDAAGADALLAPVIRQALVFLCAEAVGAMDALVKATVEYTSQRKQFGQPISKFQVLRHRMTDMYMETELTRSLLLATAWHVENKPGEADKLVAALKAKVGTAGRYVSHNAIQLHGGIGVTDELSVGHYFKRLAVIENLFGARDYHLGRYHQLRLAEAG